jgi:hypothetical protein
MTSPTTPAAADCRLVGSAPPAGDVPVMRVTLVHAAACHFCDDARTALGELAGEFPLRLESVAASEPRGESLLAEHRAAMFPLVLLDGAFFSSGRLPRRKLRRTLAALAADSGRGVR